MIQSSLNQLMAASLGATFAIGKTPTIEHTLEGRQLHKQHQFYEEAAKQARDVDKQTAKEKGTVPAEQLAVTQGIEAKALESGEQWIQHAASTGRVKPSEYVALKETQAFEQQLAASRDKLRGMILEKQQQAIESKQGVQNAVKERRSFIKAMQDQPVSFGKQSGGKFGELDPKVQKEIAKQYTKGERKKVMDEYYGK